MNKITLYKSRIGKLEFEDFLRDEHARQYKGVDDDMVDDYENWLTTLKYETYIDYANKFFSAKLEKWRLM